MKRRALFIDRDGVINVDHGYVHTREQFEFVDGIFELGVRATQLGYMLIVVTNQAGIARGYYTQEAFQVLSAWMCDVFREHDAPISRVYHCPYHPEHGIGVYKQDSSWRKPGPGMMLEAANDFDIDLEQSVLIGDRETDMRAGVSAGVGCNLLYRPLASNEIADESPTCATAVITLLSDATPYLDRQVIQTSLVRPAHATNGACT